MEEIINVLVTAGNEKSRRTILSAITKHNDIRITGIENDEAGAVIKSQRFKPDVLIMDLQPQGLDGVELASIIHRRSPETAIVMICDRDEIEYAGTALQAGISGFLQRKADINKLYLVIKIVNLGGHYISSSVIMKSFKTISFIRQFPGQFIEIQDKRKKENNCLSLSSIERRIITEIARGSSDKEIAGYFNYSEGTIKNFITAIKRKTKLKNRIQIVIFSLIFGIINLEHPDIFKHRQFINDTIQ